MPLYDPPILKEGNGHLRAYRIVDLPARPCPSQLDPRQVGCIPMGHHVAKQGKVTVVDFGSVKLDNTPQLLENGLSRGFDTKHTEYFDATVLISALEVNSFNAHHRLQVHTITLEHPLLLGS